MIRVLFSDCPYPHNDRKEFRSDNPQKKTKFGSGADGNYLQEDNKGCMSWEELYGVADALKPLLAPDAYHFQWATFPLLYGKQGNAGEVMTRWGFTYKTVAFLWAKVYPTRNRFPKDLWGYSDSIQGVSFAGAGRYTFSNAEPMLLGTRGKPWHPSTGSKPRQEVLTAEEADFEGCEDEWDNLPSSVLRIAHPRIGKLNADTGKWRNVIHHSEKPNIFQEMVYQWLSPHVGDDQFAELFARRQLPGWECMGWKLDKQDISLSLTDMGAKRGYHH